MVTKSSAARGRFTASPPSLIEFWWRSTACGPALGEGKVVNPTAQVSGSVCSPRLMRHWPVAQDEGCGGITPTVTIGPPRGDGDTALAVWHWRALYPAAAARTRQSNALVTEHLRRANALVARGGVVGGCAAPPAEGMVMETFGLARPAEHLHEFVAAFGLIPICGAYTERGVRATNGTPSRFHVFGSQRFMGLGL
jgi:hypothetical protein